MKQSSAAVAVQGRKQQQQCALLFTVDIHTRVVSFYLLVSDLHFLEEETIDTSTVVSNTIIVLFNLGVSRRTKPCTKY